jgi:hypothetical protein
MPVLSYYILLHPASWTIHLLFLLSCLRSVLFCCAFSLTRETIQCKEEFAKNEKGQKSENYIKKKKQLEKDSASSRIKRLNLVIDLDIRAQN